MSVKSFILATRWLLPRVKIYPDSMNNRYFVCDAKQWSALTDPVWRVQKISTVEIAVANVESEETVETDWYSYAVPDLSTVQSLTYY